MSSNLFIRNVAIISIMAFLFSCKRTITGEGPVVTRSIAEEAFTGVDLSIPANMKIVLADTFNCIITAQQNIIDAIKVEVDGDELEISSKYSLKTEQDISIVVSLPKAERVQVNGSGDISFINPAKGDKLNLYINGSGTIDARSEMEEVRSELNGSGTLTLAGSSKVHRCIINGSGDLHAFDLVSAEAYIEINGSGDAEVTAAEKLKAEIRGSGNIQYKGQPHLMSEVLGSGDIKKAD